MQLVGQDIADALPRDKVVLAYKNRYSIPLEKIRELIPGFEESKFEDPRYTYQPCKPASELVRKFSGEKNNRFLTTQMVDTATATIKKEDAFIIDLDVTEMIFDKLTGEYINQ